MGHLYNLLPSHMLVFHAYQFIGTQMQNQLEIIFMKGRNIFRFHIHIYLFSLSIFSVLVPLLLLDLDHLLSEPLDLLLHFHDVVPLVPVCSEHPLLC